jgi:hypothetical protein
MKSSKAILLIRMLAWMLVAGIVAASAATAAPAAPDSVARPSTPGVFRADRLQHASLALTLGVGSGLASRRAAVAFAVPIGLGLVKEAHDRRVTRFDLTDLAADVAGAALAALLVRHLEK